MSSHEAASLPLEGLYNITVHWFGNFTWAHSHVIAYLIFYITSTVTRPTHIPMSVSKYTNYIVCLCCAYTVRFGVCAYHETVRMYTRIFQVHRKKIHTYMMEQSNLMFPAICKE